MDMMTTIPVTTQVAPPAGGAPDVCWCGQDLDRVHGRHCSRCGTARAARSVVALSRLAA